MPAPKKGLKGKGVKGAEERFANALMSAMNTLGAEGWEYQRSDTLPCEERSGVMGKSTTFLNMLVFRRKISTKAGKAAPKTHAPQLSGAAPELGPATEAAEVKDPRTEADA